jgi:diguanylate cyclase
MNSNVSDNNTLANGTTGAQAYFSRIEAYAHKIRGCSEIDEIIGLLDQAMRDTLSLDGSDEFRDASARILDAQQQIASLKAELEEAMDLVLVDPLTGTLNRRGLERAFARECARCDRHGLALSLAVIDLDDFKQVNDRYGHQFGDEALAQLAEVMRATLRPSDVIARYGGEEFVVIFPHSDAPAATTAVARLQRALTVLPLLRDGDAVTLSFSAGLAGRLPRESRDDLIARADAALLVAKNSGKNKVVIAP